MKFLGYFTSNVLLTLPLSVKNNFRIFQNLLLPDTFCSHVYCSNLLLLFLQQEHTKFCKCYGRSYLLHIYCLKLFFSLRYFIMVFVIHFFIRRSLLAIIYFCFKEATLSYLGFTKIRKNI